MRKLLISLLVGFSILIIPSLLFITWYSHGHPIYRLSLEAIQNSAAAQQVLGHNIDSGWFVHLRVKEKRGRGDASYQVTGDQGQAEAKVSAYLEGGQWKFNWIWLKLPTGRFETVVDNRKLKRK